MPDGVIKVRIENFVRKIKSRSQLINECLYMIDWIASVEFSRNKLENDSIYTGIFY